MICIKCGREINTGETIVTDYDPFKEGGVRDPVEHADCPTTAGQGRIMEPDPNVPPDHNC